MPWLIFKRDVQLALRRGGGAGATLAFCLIVFAVFAFSLGPEALAANLARVLGVTVLLSCLLALPGLFERDYDDGTLEQYLLKPFALEWVMLAKLTAFWLTSALPLILLSPLLAAMCGLEEENVYALAFALLLATPSLCALGAVGAALTLGLRQGGITQLLVVLPLYTPPLIFLSAAAENMLAYGALGAMALVAVPASCLICALLLRMGYD